MNGETFKDSDGSLYTIVSGPLPPVSHPSLLMVPQAGWGELSFRDKYFKRDPRSKAARPFVVGYHNPRFSFF